MNSNIFQQDDDFLNLNTLDNYEDESLMQQIHFNQILSKLIDNYQNIDSDQKNTSCDQIEKSIDELEISDDIIFLEEKTQQPTSSEILKFNADKDVVDDDICFLHEEEAPKLSNKRSNYYDKDNEVDEKEVMKRWRCKNLSDSKVNLSQTQYRLRIFKDQNAKQPTERVFKKSIFENCSEISSQNDGVDNNNNNNNMNNEQQPDSKFSGRFKKLERKNQIESLSGSIYIDFNLPIEKEIEDGEICDDNDEIVLKKRNEEIKIKCKELDRECYLRYKEQKRSLLEVFKQQQTMLQIVFEQQKCENFSLKAIKKDNYEKQSICQKLYLEAVDAITADFRNECKNIKKSEESQINALKALFDSGKYEKGKLDQYFTLGVMQPAAKRRRYQDDGSRHVLLHESKLRNILIEDTIYSYYYGEPF
jgi:hypothetical protein